MDDSLKMDMSLFMWWLPDPGNLVLSLWISCMSRPSGQSLRSRKSRKGVNADLRPAGKQARRPALP